MFNDILIIALYVIIPIVLLVLFFCWLFFVSRGHRNVNVKLAFLGVTLEIGSKEDDDDNQILEKKPKDVYNYKRY